MSRISLVNRLAVYFAATAMVISILSSIVVRDVCATMPDCPPAAAITWIESHSIGSRDSRISQLSPSPEQLDPGGMFSRPVFPPRPQTLLLSTCFPSATNGSQRLVAQAPTPATATNKELLVDENQLAALGIRVLQGRHLTLYTDLRSTREVDELPAVFDLAVPQLCSYFQIDPTTASNFRVHCSLIQDKARFSRAGLFPDDLPPFPHGFNRGTTAWVYEQPSAYYRRHLVIHEGTHALMESILGAAGPPWYREGMAELLATHQWQNGKLTLKYFPQDKRETPEWGRIKIIKDEIKANRGMPLVDIMRYDTRAHLRNEAYAWSWAATIFFDTLPETQQAFRDLRKAVNQSPKQFNRDFYDQLRKQWSHLQEQWQTFILEIDYGYDLASNVIARVPVNDLVGNATTTVSATRGWQSSAIRVQAGRKYRITATGRFQIGADEQPWFSEAGGITLQYHAGRPLGLLLAAVTDESRPLVGVTPLSKPIGIGLEAELVPKSTGTLFLRINDSPASLADNQGALTVKIEAID